MNIYRRESILCQIEMRYSGRIIAVYLNHVFSENPQSFIVINFEIYYSPDSNGITQ